MKGICQFIYCWLDLENFPNCCRYSNPLNLKVCFTVVDRQELTTVMSWWDEVQAWLHIRMKFTLPKMYRCWSQIQTSVYGSIIVVLRNLRCHPMPDLSNSPIYRYRINTRFMYHLTTATRILYTSKWYQKELYWYSSEQENGLI